MQLNGSGYCFVTHRIEEVVFVAGVFDPGKPGLAEASYKIPIPRLMND